MSFIDAAFGKIFADGVELELLGGLNFIGFNVTPDETNGRYNIEIDVLELGYDTDDISNNSSLLGGTGTLTAALNAVVDGLAALTASIAAVTTQQTRFGIPTQGADLGDANETLNISAGANYYMPPTTTSAARDKTIGNTGAAAGASVTLVIAQQGHNVVIKDNGGATLHTVTAGQKHVVSLKYSTGTSLYLLDWWKPLA